MGNLVWALVALVLAGLCWLLWIDQPAQGHALAPVPERTISMVEGLAAAQIPTGQG